jgi:hypothetical protein
MAFYQKWAFRDLADTRRRSSRMFKIIKIILAYLAYLTYLPYIPNLFKTLGTARLLTATLFTAETVC